MKTALRPDPQPLVLGIVLSVVGHVAVATLLIAGSMVAQWLFPTKPLIDPNNAIEVSMVVLPKSPTAMVQKAERAPDTPQGDTMAAKEPPPPKQSDLAFEKEDEKQKGDKEKKADDERRRKLEELKRKALVDASAPIGTTDRQAADPNSDATEGIYSPGVAGLGDVEFAKWKAKIQARVMDEFRPLPTIAAANPDILCVMSVTYDPTTGEVTSYAVKKSSGNPSYDAAAERAILAMGRLPLPPPSASKYTSFTVNFTPKA